MIEYITYMYVIFSFHFCSYEWYRNDYSLPIDANIEMSDTDGTITIDPATSLDEGYYQCRAINNHGVALSVTTYLQKAGKFTINSLLFIAQNCLVHLIGTYFTFII